MPNHHERRFLIVFGMYACNHEHLLDTPTHTIAHATMNLAMYLVLLHTLAIVGHRAHKEVLQLRRWQQPYDPIVHHTFLHHEDTRQSFHLCACVTIRRQSVETLCSMVIIMFDGKINKYKIYTHVYTCSN